MKLRTVVSEHRRAAVVAVVAGLVAIGLAVYWFGPQYLFIDRRVNEALPTVSADPVTGGIAADPGDVGGGQGSPQAADPKVLARGEFRSLENASSGTALLVQLADGSTIVRFEDLSTSLGPDVRVYLSAAPASGDPGALDDEFVDLGALKGNEGNQNYVVPPNVDPAKYRSAVIWCRRFNVGFAVAPLDAGSSG